MKIGILGAMEQEVAILAARMTNVRTETRALRMYMQGQLAGCEVVLVFSRWGKVAAAATVTTLIERYHVDMVLMTGVAGAADPALMPGDIAIGDRFIQHDLDTLALGNPPFTLPLLGISEIEADPSITQALQAAAQRYITQRMSDDVPPSLLRELGIAHPRVAVGTIASGDQFIADHDTVVRLRGAIAGLQCVEMEGAAVAQVCYEHSIPYGVIRVMSDRADKSAALDFDVFVNRVAKYLTGGVVWEFLSAFNA